MKNIDIFGERSCCEILPAEALGNNKLADMRIIQLSSRVQRLKLFKSHPSG